MTNSTRSLFIAIIRQNETNLMDMLTLYKHLSSGDIFWPKKRSIVLRVQHYVEVTIPHYSIDDFKSHFRMTRGTYQMTCLLLRPLPEYNQTTGPIPNVEKDVLMFLWFIGNPESIRSMSDRLNVSKCTFHKSIKRTGSALVRVMPIIIRWPSNAAAINETARMFSERSQFQNVLGAVDGSHIHITAPKHFHQDYFNRKGFCLPLVIPMSFNYVWTGNPGSTHDSTVLRSSYLFSNCNEKIPQGFYLLRDSGFPLLRWLITPFRDHGNLSRQQKLFNKTHSKCREVIERAFGLLKSRFRRPFRFEVIDTTILVNSVLAACVLHNICLAEHDEYELEEPPDTDNMDNDETFTRDGHELPGLQMRQQLMHQLLNIQ